MKIKFVTYCSKEYAPLGAITLPNRRAYCQRHGYELQIHENPVGDQGMAWDKILIILEALKTADVVVWNGLDVLVMNQEFRVETLLAKHPRASALLTTDFLGMNSDNMIFRRDHWSEQLLHAVRTFGHVLYRNHVWAEQEAFIRFTSSAPYLGHVGWVEQNVMNSYINSLYGRPSEWPGDYRPGDWLVHLPGIKNEQRLPIAEKLAAFAQTPAALGRRQGSPQGAAA